MIFWSLLFIFSPGNWKKCNTIFPNEFLINNHYKDYTPTLFPITDLYWWVGSNSIALNCFLPLQHKPGIFQPASNPPYSGQGNNWSFSKAPASAYSFRARYSERIFTIFLGTTQPQHTQMLYLSKEWGDADYKGLPDS